MLQSFCDWIQPPHGLPKAMDKNFFFLAPAFWGRSIDASSFHGIVLGISIAIHDLRCPIASKYVRNIFFKSFAVNTKKGRFSSCPSPRISWNSPQLTSYMKFQQLGFPTSRFKSSMTWFTTSMCSSCQQVIPLHLPSKKNNGRSPKAAILAKTL